MSLIPFVPFTKDLKAVLAGDPTEIARSMILNKGAEEVSIPSSLCLDDQAIEQHASRIDTGVEVR